MISFVIYLFQKLAEFIEQILENENFVFYLRTSKSYSNLQTPFRHFSIVRIV